MAAHDILRSNKTSIEETLGLDSTRILIKAYEKKLINSREYNSLRWCMKLHGSNQGHHIVWLVDKIMKKGEKNCLAFLKLLQTDEDIQETYPELKNILEDGQYVLNSQPTGLCLIINNKTFPVEDIKINDNVRRGTDKDAGSLGEVFTSLGFRVLMCKDQTKDQMERVLKCFASQCDLSQLQEFKVQEWTGSGFTDLREAPRHGDAFICCVLSHGDKGVVLGVDWEPLRIKQITRTFMATDQSPLTAKPKVFLIQACQGHQIHPKVVLKGLQADSSRSTRQADGSHSTRQADDSRSTQQADESHSTPMPQEADFLVHCSTVEDYFSIRNPEVGSWFIQSVCEELEMGCERKEEIEVILRRVNKEVARKEAVLRRGPSCDPSCGPSCTSCGPTTQMPAIRHTLRKRLVLTHRN